MTPKPETVASGSQDLFTGVAHAAKYQSQNWIAETLVENFMRSILRTVQQAGSTDVHEIGCGEGHISGLLAANRFEVRGCDISIESLAVAKAEAAKRDLAIQFDVNSVYELDPDRDSASTVLCCEVLEHLEQPANALRKLLSVTKRNLILSVPNEPIWRILNLVRGKYWAGLGNTPGHIQHWSRRQFVRWVRSYAEVVEVKTPLPWTIVHCRPYERAKK